MKKSTFLLWAGLMVTLLLTWRISVKEGAQQAVLPTKILAQTNNNETQNNVTQSVQQTNTLQLRKSYESLTDLFALAEVKKAAVESSRQKVTTQPIIVPPLPLKYIGRWQDQTQLMVVLRLNDEIVNAKVGDIVFNQYQVMHISENTQGLTVEFLNQPFHQTQVLQVGKAQDE